MSVVAFHAFPSIVSGGFLGVDVFFVISGFLVGGIVLRGQAENGWSVSEFYRRRVVRLFPSLFVVLLACMTVGFARLYDVEFYQLAQHTFFGAFGLANLSLHQDDGYFSLASKTNAALHLWSLGVEEQFYVFLPAILLLDSKRRFILPVLLSCFFGSLLVSLDPSHSFDVASKFYLPQFRAWELMAGVLLAYANQRQSFARERHSCNLSANFRSVAGLLCIGAAIILFDNESVAWRAELLVVLATVLLISAGSDSLINRYMLGNRAAILVGRISYPLYLWHWPLLAFGSLFHPTFDAKIRLVLVIVAFVLAYLTWRFVERPIRYGNFPGVHKKLFFAMAFVSLASAIVLLEDGRVGWATDTPQLAFLSSPKPESKPDCEQRYFNRRYNVAVQCSSPAAGSQPSAVLIGDSHAYQLFSGLEYYYRRHGKDIVSLTMSGCPIFPETIERQSCSDGYHAILEKIASMSSVNTVIIGEYVPFMVSDNRPHWSSEVRSMVTHFTERGVKVILMLDTPEIGVEPRQFCYSRFGNLPEKTLDARCSIALSKYEAKVAQYRDKAAEAVKGINGVVVFDLAKYICNGTRCNGIVDGNVIYRDENHLNYAGSMYLARFYNWEETTGLDSPPRNIVSLEKYGASP